MTMDKDEIIRVAEMNIDDLRKSKMKKIFTCLGISAVIVGSVGIAKAAGIQGMVAGQVADMENQGKEPKEDALIFIHENKTTEITEWFRRRQGAGFLCDKEGRTDTSWQIMQKK